MTGGLLLLEADDVRTGGGAPNGGGVSGGRTPSSSAGLPFWRWRLVDADTGSTLADHEVTIDPAAGEFAAFTDLYRYLRRNADPAQRLASEQQLLTQVGEWAGTHLLGDEIGSMVVREAPATLRIVVPDVLGFLPLWPWEIAQVGGKPLARHDITIVYGTAPPDGDPPTGGPPESGRGGGAAHDTPTAGRPAVPQPRPVGEALRILAVFSLPARATALGLRRERYALAGLVRRLAARHRIELTVLQYGVTKEKLAETVDSGEGWDVVHISGHGDVGRLKLEKADGSPDPLDVDELVGMLRPARRQVKLVVLSACQSATATTAQTLRWLGLDADAEVFQAQAEAEVARTPAGDVGNTGAIGDNSSGRDVDGGDNGGSVAGGDGDSGGAAQADASEGDRRSAGLAQAVAYELRGRIPPGRGRRGLAQATADELGCAVLAMRYPVSDEFAIRLTGTLYERMFARRLPLDAALRRALPYAAGPANPDELTDAVPPVCLATPALFGGEAAGRRIVPPAGRQPFRADLTMAYFEEEPPRFVGRAGPMARASAALAPESGYSGVLFHGMAGAGKTACALELAYRHADAFEAALFWKAPSTPDTLGVALGTFAEAWELQLASSGLPPLDRVTTLGQLRGFAPVLAALCRQHALLIVLDNLQTLLTETGAWRDERWPVLLAALTGHHGLSRVMFTGRVPPDGLDRGRILVEPVHALALDEAALLARELPHLGALLHADTTPGRAVATATRRPTEEEIRADRDLVRRVLHVVQGHPKLLELADAAAGVDRDVLAARVAEAEKTEEGRGPALAAFFAHGENRLDTGGIVAVLASWVAAAVAALDEPAALLLQVLCCLEDDDRTSPVVESTWAGIWGRLGHLGAPPPAGELLAALAQAALVVVDTTGAGIGRVLAVSWPGGAAPAGGGDGTAAGAGSVPPGDEITGLAGAEADASLAGAGAGSTDGGYAGRAPLMLLFRVHPAVAEAVRAGTPEPVRAAVDIKLTAYWKAVFDWARGLPGGEASRAVARAGVAAAPYLLRRQIWDHAAYLLEEAFLRDRQNPAMALTVLPLLHRVADVTGTHTDLGSFGRVLAQVDPARAEQVLRQALDQTVAADDFHAASIYGGELVNLLAGMGRLREALAVTETTADYTRQAGLGPWAHALDDSRRLQILLRMGRAEQVLAALDGTGGLLARLDAMSEARDPTDTVYRWNVREGVWQLGALAAKDLGQWELALELNGRVQASRRHRSASAHETAWVRFNDYVPLLRLGRLGEAEALLADCQQTYTETGDITGLGDVFCARASLAYDRGHHSEAAHLQRVAFRLMYTRPNPANIAVSHGSFALYLTSTGAEPASVLAHVLAASVLDRLVGNTERDSLRAVAVSLGPTGTVPPVTVAGLTATVEQVEGVRFAALVDALCPDRTTADQALCDILETARTLPAEEFEASDVEQLLAAFESIIDAVAAAASNGGRAGPAPRLDPDFDRYLAEMAGTAELAPLAAALRRIIAGERNQDQLTAGLDTVGTIIVTATVSRLATAYE